MDAGDEDDPPRRRQVEGGARGERRRLDPGHRPDPFERVTQEAVPAPVVVADHVQVGVDGGDAVRIEPERDVRRHPRRAAGEQAGEHQQGDGDRQLRGHQRIAQEPPSPAGARNGHRTVHVTHQVPPRRVEGRHETGQHARASGRRRREQQRAPVERELPRDGQRDGRLHPGEQAQDAPRQRQPRRGAEGRQHEALRQQLPHEAAPARADREPDRDLAPAARRRGPAACP